MVGSTLHGKSHEVKVAAASRETKVAANRESAILKTSRSAGTPMAANDSHPLVGVIMGSKSDWDTLQHTDTILSHFGVPHECKIVSAHRTPQWMADYAIAAEGRGLQIIIAGAGGAAHLPGMAAAHTILPVLGVPVHSQALGGPGFFAVDRANARRRSGRHDGHRQGRRRSTPVCWPSRCLRPPGLSCAKSFASIGGIKPRRFCRIPCPLESLMRTRDAQAAFAKRAVASVPCASNPCESSDFTIPPCSINACGRC